MAKIKSGFQRPLFEWYSLNEYHPRVGGDPTKGFYMYVYIMASKKDGVLYIGATQDLQRRVYEHKGRFVAGFTRKYFVHKLVYYEVAGSMDGALLREKQLKKWNRKWKIKLIEEFNPEWKDLYNDL